MGRQLCVGCRLADADGRHQLARLPPVGRHKFTIDLFGREIALGAEALGLGGVGLARVIPIMVFAIIGGTLADVTNRRKLLIITNGIAALLAAVLAWLSFSQRDTVLAIYLLTAAGISHRRILVARPSSR